MDSEEGDSLQKSFITVQSTITLWQWCNNHKRAHQDVITLFPDVQLKYTQNENNAPLRARLEHLIVLLG